MQNNESICVVSHMSPQQTWGQRSSRGQWPLVQFLVWGQIWYYNDCKSMWSRKQARLVVSRTALFLVPFKCWQHCWITLENQTPIQLSNWIKSQHFQIFSSKKKWKGRVVRSDRCIQKLFFVLIMIYHTREKKNFTSMVQCVERNLSVAA